jgi:hypothetical protein
MGKLRRGNYVFVWWKSDHRPRHVHVYRDGVLVAKWDLDHGKLMLGHASKKVLALIDDLVREGAL